MYPLCFDDIEYVVTFPCPIFQFFDCVSFNQKNNSNLLLCILRIPIIIPIKYLIKDISQWRIIIVKTWLVAGSSVKIKWNNFAIMLSIPLNNNENSTSNVNLVKYLFISNVLVYVVMWYWCWYCWVSVVADVK